MIRFYATIFMKLIQIDDQLIAKKKVATGVLYIAEVSCRPKTLS